MDTQQTGLSNIRENRRGQSRMDNPETLVTLDTQQTELSNIRENIRGNQEWTIQRH